MKETEFVGDAEMEAEAYSGPTGKVILALEKLALENIIAAGSCQNMTIKEARLLAGAITADVVQKLREGL